METLSLSTTKGTTLTTAEPLRLEHNPAAVYLASLKPNSRRTMAGALNTLAKMLGTPPAWIEEEPSEDRRRRARREVTYLFCRWQDLRIQHTSAVRARLAAEYAPKTANRMLSALRQVLERCWDLGLMSADEYAKAAKVKRCEGSRLLAGRAIQAGELAALMDACAHDTSPAGARDAAVIAVLYSCGLRRAELVGLDLADYDAEAGELLVLGKRNKERLVPVVNGAAEALGDWLTVRGAEAGPLFVAIRKGGAIQHGQRLTTEAIWHLLKRRAEAAGVTRLSPHDFRRSMITDLWASGANPAAIQKLAGHESMDTTARYDRSGEAAKRKAAELLHVPYRRRRLV